MLGRVTRSALNRNSHLTTLAKCHEHAIVAYVYRSHCTAERVKLSRSDGPCVGVAISA